MGCDTSRKLPYQYECGLPSDINNVDVEFFNLLLKDNKVTSAKMEEVMVPDPQGEGEVKDGGGASGSGIKRYILEYATINKEDTIQQPKSLILKYSNILEFDDIGFGARAVWGWVLKLGDVQARMVKNEHVFYDKYSNQAKKDWGVDVPHCYKSLLYDGTEPSNTAWVLYNTRVDRQHLVILEDLKDYKNAFENFEKANSIVKRLTKYKINDDQELFYKIKKNFTNKEIALAKHNKSKIIFILGMPRSGTSLVEQIISSHHQVFGAGELVYLNEIMKKKIITKTRKF